MIDSLPEKHGSLGSPGINNLKWIKPVFPGYILSAKSKIIECRLLKSQPGVGIVKAEYEVVNQHGDTVMTMESNAFMRCKNS